MRLTCPNCDARYAVSAAMIPRAGREVECSACGHVWFFVPDTAAAAAAGATPAPETAPQPAADPDTVSAPESPPAPKPADGPAPDAEDAPAPAEIPPARERVDPAVLGVLREEAARESAARRAEAVRGGAAPLVTPGPAHPRAPYLEAPPAARATGAPGDAPAHEAASEEPAPEAAPESSETALMRRVRSRAGADAATTPDPLARRGAARRGFAAGLGLVIVIAAAGALVYAGADEIAATWPAAAEPLAAYVDAVDAAHRRIAAGAAQAGAAIGDFVAGLGD